MKHTFFLFVSLLLLSSIGCQQQGTDGDEVTEAKEVSLETWNAVKEEYHHFMAFTFHPAEDGDLAPIKKDHDAMAAKAKEFAGLAIPGELAGKGLDERVQRLAKETEALSALIESGAGDEEIKTALFGLHDVYHGVEEASMMH